MSNKQVASTSYKLPTECAACGGDLPDIRQRYGRYKDFCSLQCRNTGRAWCKYCGKDLPQSKISRRDFCDNNNSCWGRYHRTGTTGTTYLEERYRSTCKRCGKPITQPKHGGKYFCGQRCLLSYKRITQAGLDDTEKWGQYAPETRKVLRELDYAGMSMTAKRLATAIDREYTARTEKSWDSQSVRVGHICKGCKKKFHRKAFSFMSTEYCSLICQQKVEQGIEEVPRVGENNVRAKVTWEQVDEIRSLYAAKQMSYRELGEKYGLSMGGITSIIYELTWKPENDPRRKQSSEASNDNY